MLMAILALFCCVQPFLAALVSWRRVRLVDHWVGIPFRDGRLAADRSGLSTGELPFPEELKTKMFFKPGHLNISG